MIPKKMKTSTLQVPKPGKFGAEIDDIFGGRNKKKPEIEIPEKKDTKVEIAKWKKKKKKKTTCLKKPELEIPEKKDCKLEIAKEERKRKRNELDDGFNNTSKRRRRKRTAEGFAVYTEDELRVNKPNAGDTRLCPFDSFEAIKNPSKWPPYRLYLNKIHRLLLDQTYEAEKIFVAPLF